MRWKMVVAYDGSDYLGWQSQKGGGAVQDLLEAELKKIFKKEVRLHGASRTDQGVHAKAQVAHFDADWTYGAQKLKKAIQSGLDKQIVVTKLIHVSDSFHARFSARGKRYRYTLILGQATPFEIRWGWEVPYKVDVMRLARALKVFEGRHDFRPFAGHVNQGETTIKTIYTARLVCTNARRAVIEIEGSGFLYKMVRAMVGAAVDVARGKLTLTRLRELLKSPVRTHEVITAPAKGLCLEKVFY